MKRLAFTITEKDVDDSIRCFSAFPPATFDTLRPSQVVSPVTTSLLRTTPTGFPLVTYEEVIFVRDETGKALRIIFKKFLSGHCTPEHFANAALPLVKKLLEEHKS